MCLFQMSANFTHHYLFRNKFLNSAVTGFFLTIRWTLRQVIQDPHSHPARFTAAVPPNRQAPTRHCIRRSKFTHIRKAERIHGTFQKNALIKHAVFHASGRWVGLSQVCRSVCPRSSPLLPASPEAICPAGQARMRVSLSEACLDHHSWK